MYTGFGSYDESERQNREVDAEDDGDGVTVHENEHEGEVTFEANASTDDLIGRLEDMKDSNNEA